jgi:alkylation response protein AidB-like acyl-CoA dehydrogenase
MNFEHTAERQALREDVRAWCDDHRERIAECDRESEFPRELYREGMERGFGNVIIPEEYGGGGGGATEYALVAEETGIFQICFQVQRSLLAAGNDEQQERYLPGFASGDLVGAISISEPETGSSLKSMDTVAVKEGDQYVLSGTKSHVNLAAEADLHKVYTMTEEGLTAFLVEDDNPGLTVSPKLDPIGTRYLPLYDVELDECVVDADQILMAPGDGYDVFFKTFNFSRIGNASEMLGHGKRALEGAVEWAKEREVGDDHVTDFQGMRWKIAELATQLRAAERIRDEAAWRIDNGDSGALETSMAKLACANAALPATTESIQITGATGLYRDQPYEAHFRNVKTLEVAGGSREIMKNVIADNLIEGDSPLVL